VTTMSSMFINALVFNQNLASWNVANVTTMTGMFQGSALNQANYDPILLAWSAQNVKTGVGFHGGTAKYSAAAARTFLTGTKTWTITDGGAVTVPQPSAFTGTPDSATQITLNWTSGGGSTSDFIVVYTTGATAPTSCWSGTSTTAATNSRVITGLTTVTQYAFRVCSRTTGAGEVSAGVTATATTP